MHKKYIFAVLFLSTFFVTTCNSPESIPPASHFTRVPYAINLSAVSDTTATGKALISLSWGVSGTQNLRSFEVYRSVNNPTKFSGLLPTVTVTAFVDSFDRAGINKVYYYIVATGNDRFIGKNSDILEVPIIK